MTSTPHTSPHKTFAAILVAIVIVSLVGFSTPPKVHAQMSVIDAANLVWNRVSAIAEELVSDILGSIEIKEFVLDEIAWSLAKRASQELTASTIDWINSGFEGSPAFITDLDQYLTTIADEVAGEFIYGSDLGFLCSPLELNVKIALEAARSQRDFRYAECSLSGVVDNVDNFLSGNFAAGGWPGWFEMMINRENTLVGATRIAQIELENRILNAQSQEKWTLDWGDGFLSWEECIDEPGNAKPQCKIMTPGKAISEQLTFELSVGQRTLIEADEINEIISALFAQLAQQALQGAGGLLGLSSGSGGSPSYTSRIRAGAGGTIGQGGGSSAAVSFISGAIADERAYRALIQRVVDRATGVVAQAEAEGSCNSSIAASASAVRTEYGALVTESLNAEALLQGMQFRYDAAGPEERLLIAEEFERLRTAGTLHGRVANVRVEVETNEELGRLSNLAGNIRSCSGGSGQSGVER